MNFKIEGRLFTYRVPNCDKITERSSFLRYTVHRKKKEDKNMSVITITKENFNREVLHSDKPVLLDFWASWCGPCRMVSPVVDQIAQEHPEIRVGKVNVDEQPELAGFYRVASIPTLLVMKEGKVVNQMVGARPKAMIESML